MAVMTHAHHQATEADYNLLSGGQQDTFDHLMEEADIAGPATYPVYMTAIATLTGLPDGELRKCGCSCWCPVIFDADHPDAHIIETGDGYNLGRHQCPRCADEHRETA